MFVLPETLCSTDLATMGFFKRLHTAAAVNIDSVNLSPFRQKFHKSKEWAKSITYSFELELRQLCMTQTLLFQSWRPKLLSHSPRQFSETSCSFLLLPFILSSKYYVQPRQLLLILNSQKQRRRHLEGIVTQYNSFCDKADIQRNTIQSFLAV